MTAETIVGYLVSALVFIAGVVVTVLQRGVAAKLSELGALKDRLVSHELEDAKTHGTLVTRDDLDRGLEKLRVEIESLKALLVAHQLEDSGRHRLPAGGGS